MKKLLLLAFAVIAVTTTAFSQVEKGDISGTASLSFSSQMPEEGDNQNSTTLFIRGGYFFTNNVEAGLTFLVSGSQDVTATGIGPYAVYNFLTEGGKILPYAGANFLNLSTNQEGADAINQLGAVAGLKYFLTEVVNIDTSLNYTTWLGDIGGSALQLNVGIGINFGKLK
jgi:hypothetical protein